MTHGFGKINNITLNIDRYKGKPVCAHSAAGQTVYGVFIGINRDVKTPCAEFKPSLVGNPDTSEVAWIDYLPTTLDIPIVAVRPLPDGMLERFVENHKEKQKKEKEKK